MTSVVKCSPCVRPLNPHQEAPLGRPAVGPHCCWVFWIFLDRIFQTSDLQDRDTMKRILNQAKMKLLIGNKYCNDRTMEESDGDGNSHSHSEDEIVGCWHITLVKFNIGATFKQSFLGFSS